MVGELVGMCRKHNAQWIKMVDLFLANGEKNHQSCQINSLQNYPLYDIATEVITETADIKLRT